LKSRISGAPLAFVLAGASLLFLFATLAFAQKKQLPAHPVDLNSATAVELQQVPGIGPTTAHAIVNFREKSGPFKRVEDLLAIRGISKQALERMRPYVVVNPPEANSTKPN